MEGAPVRALEYMCLWEFRVMAHNLSKIVKYDPQTGQNFQQES